MNIFKKLFNIQESSKDKEIKKQDVHLSLDDLFVHHFIDKGGKFLYSTSLQEIANNLICVLEENNWKNITCLDPDQLSVYTDQLSIEVNSNIETKTPIFTSCEHLIADSGSILFSSNQLKENKLNTLSKDFIVFAKTSQLVKNMGEGLTGIKSNFKENIPTNICAVKNYSLDKSDDNDLTFGLNNSKNLYLLLLEDL
ncbi:LUD domain-containing protein [Flavicella sediminum]|uniref:LUD domain-containing protein n=1 Tax=Flavicella sediminum TaxID=2585141 RepID=UPI00111CEF51|nr:LUD domain-containing protein [Flavicella sediminum]